MFSFKRDVNYVYREKKNVENMHKDMECMAKGTNFGIGFRFPFPIDFYKTKNKEKSKTSLPN